jgi:benzoyl-CoA reductase subunit A
MAEQRQEYWRWQEDCVVNPDMDWRTAQVITMGIDVRSVSSEAVVCLDGEIYAYNTIRTGPSSSEPAENAARVLFAETGLRFEDVDHTVGTGYGRVNIPFTNTVITEIACHGRGANHIGGPAVRTILDMGGRTARPSGSIPAARSRVS